MGLEGNPSYLASKTFQASGNPRAGCTLPLIIFLLALLHLGDYDAVQSLESGGIATRKQSNTAGEPLRTKININNISAWYDADGFEEDVGSYGNAGFSYPKGTGNVIFTAGMMWSGEVYDGLTPTLRTNGAAYNRGFIRGRILGNRTGEAEDPDAPDVRIWRIRRDFASAELKEDAADLNNVPVTNLTTEQIDAVREQYQTDWLEWPAHKGAPFYDADGDGLYVPEIFDGSPTLYPEADEPGVAGADQVVWYVANDINRICSPWGCTPSVGLEVQTTVWAHRTPSPLTEAIFKRRRLIYKGDLHTPEDAWIDSIYVGQFVDADLGAYHDDFAGCDTLLNLGYVYNGLPQDPEFQEYGLQPPSIGYVTVQGPLVTGVAGEDRNRNGIDDAMDRGIFDLQATSYGMINLPMTAFTYMASGDPYADPPFSYGGAIQWNQLLRGVPPTPQGPPDPPPRIDPVSGMPSIFWANGDPIRRTGWIDGIFDGPGDRRFVPASGPFMLALGDTQEIVMSVVGGLGSDNLNSVERMKHNSRYVQLVYDSLFSLPGPPASPVVRALGFDREILLDWEFDARGVLRTEDSLVVGGYLFEGYKVYQFTDASGNLEDAKLLAQFDLVNGVKTIKQLMADPVTGELLLQNVQYGTDSGIKRTFIVRVDCVRGGLPLVNGRMYYFGVSAYSYTRDSLLQVRTYESEPSVVVVQPETPKPGTRYPYGIDDTLMVLQVVGQSDAQIKPVVYNPSVQSGETYQLSVDTTAEGALAWTLMDLTSDSVLLAGIEDLSGEQPYRIRESGLDLYIKAPPVGVVSVVDQDNANVFGTLALGADTTLATFRGTSPETGEDYEIRFGEESFVLNMASPLFFSRAIRVPFAVYDVGRGLTDSTARQVIASVKDTLATADTWDLVEGGVYFDDTLYNVFEPIYVSSYTYPEDDPSTTVREDSVGVKQMQNDLLGVLNIPDHEKSALRRVFIRDLDGDGLPPESGFVRFNKYHELRQGDAYEIRLDRVVTGNVDLAKADIAAIKAFPNPYYGMNVDETSLTDRFITFNHLPAKAVIRIYNLAGIHVRRLEKDDPTTQYFRWDLRNESGKSVASGIYVVYMELEDEQGVPLGTRTLKLVIIQGAQ